MPPRGVAGGRCKGQGLQRAALFVLQLMQGVAVAKSSIMVCMYGSRPGMPHACLGTHPPSPYRHLSSSGLTWVNAEDGVTPPGLARGAPPMGVWRRERSHEAAGSRPM